MICRKCGAEFSDDTKVCPQCGEELEQEAAQKISLTKETSQIDSINDTQEMEEADVQEEKTKQPSEESQETEDVLQFSDTSFSNNSGVTGYNDPIPDESPKKKGKGPIIAIGVLGIAFVALVLYLVVSLFTKEDSAKEYVQKAFENTIEVLAVTDGQKGNELLKKDVYKVESNFSIDEFSISQYGQELLNINSIGTIRFQASNVVDQIQDIMLTSLKIGFGDMKDIELQFYIEDDSYYFSFPDLYGELFKAKLSDFGYDEISPEKLLEQQKTQEALLSLGTSFAELFWRRFDTIIFKKTEQTVLDSGEKMQEVLLSMKGTDYNSFLDEMRNMIERNDLFLEWIAALNFEDVDDVVENIEDMIEEAKIENTRQDIILCYLYINENKQIAGIRIPAEDSEEGIDGSIELYMLGKDKLTDDMKITASVEQYGDAINFTYYNYKEEENYHLGMTLADDTDSVIEFSCSYNYTENENSATINMNDIKFEFDTGYEQLFMGLHGTYKIKEEETVEIHSEDAVDVITMSETEMEDIVLVILKNALEGGYVPSAYQNDLKDLIEELEDYKNAYNPDNSSDLDGSDKLSYEEYKELVKEIYGDIFTEEELQEIYEEIYGSDSMSDEE